MAKITEDKVTNRSIVCSGEVKLEFIELDASSGSTGDYVVSNLQNPQVAYVTYKDSVGLKTGDAEVDSTQESGKAVVLRSGLSGNTDGTLVVVVGY